MTLLSSCEGWPGMAAAQAALAAGRSALDAVELGVRAVEAEKRVESVGYGGIPDMIGEVTCDAAVMDGRTLGAGAVGALAGFRHAVSVARQVMEKLPHVLLVGDGAARFAREVGAEACELLTPEQRQLYEQWLEKNVPAAERGRWPEVPLAQYAWESGKDMVSADTVVFLAVDSAGNFAAATSTSGWAYRYPGRLGDSPIVGAGLYADSRYGACGCTNVGEMTIRAATARSVVLYMKRGAALREACLEAMRDLGDLKGGFLGPVMIHALDREGSGCVLTPREMGRKSTFFYWAEGMAEPRPAQAELVRP